MPETQNAQLEAERLEDAMIGSVTVRCLVAEALDAEAKSQATRADHAWRRVNLAVKHYGEG
jgi:hypothetical protein